MAVLIRDPSANQFKDRTRDVSEIRTLDQRIEIVFNKNSKLFKYGWDRVRILRDPKRHPLAEGEWVEANGSVWESATEVLTFSGTGGTWSRIFYRTQGVEKYSTYPASQVRVITSATETPAVAEVLRYWREVVSCLPRDDPLRPGYEKLAFVHPDSVLNSFLSGSPIEERPGDITPTTGEPNFEEGLQAAALEAELADERDNRSVSDNHIPNRCPAGQNHDRGQKWPDSSQN